MWRVVCGGAPPLGPGCAGSGQADRVWRDQNWWGPELGVW